MKLSESVKTLHKIIFVHELEGKRAKLEGEVRELERRKERLQKDVEKLKEELRAVGR